MHPAIQFNTLNLQVLTDTGFRPFVGIALTNINAETIRFTFNDDSTVEVTNKHKFVVQLPALVQGVSDEGISVHAQSLSIGDSVSTMMGGTLTITDIEYGIEQPTFELLEVGGNRYTTNGVISHNCEFLSSDPTLLDPIILGALEKQIQQPIAEDMGFRFWQHIRSKRMYLLGVDPATGSKEDFTVMTLIDFQDLSIVAEFRSNTMSSPQAYASLKMLLLKIEAMESTCYFSVENNGVGEGIIALYENDEFPPQHCEFISEEGANRLGMRTESRVKLRACLVLKQLIESGKMKIVSDTLVKELCSYITQRNTYAAQRGSTDDIISSILIVVRLLEEMSTYDTKAFDVVNTYNELGTFSKSIESNEESEYDDGYTPDGMII